MTPRERKMALTLGVLLLLGLGAVGYLMVLRPLQEGTARRDALQKEVDELTEQADKLRASQPKLAAAKRKSLPANPAPVTKPGQGVPAATTLAPSEASNAKLEYTLLLTRLLARAKIPTTSVSVSDRALDARGIPLIPNTKKPAYLRAAWNVEIRNIDMWELHDFLVAFYQVDLLHQITGLTITRDETPTGGKKAELSRHDLTVKLTAEAIMLDGAERRPNLIVVPSGFAAVGGTGGHAAVSYNPQYPARLINPFRAHPILATGHRDYSYIVLKDMFHGHLPTAPKPSFDRIPDVAVKLGEPIAPVKVTLGGELPPGPIKWDVKYGGKILPPGSVKVEPSRQGPAATVSLTPAEGEAGFAQVEVIATLPDGKQLTNTLKVGVSALPPKDEISAYIFLTNTTVRSDGTATATIRDRYNPFDYEVRAGRDGVKVQKYWYLTATQRKEDGPTTPQLMIGDENVTATQKVFKVVALDDDGLILLDVTQPPAKPWLMVGIPIGPAAPGAAKGFGPGAAPGKFGPGAGKGSQPSFVPLAGAVGVPNAILPPTASPKLYRWSLGKSLRQLTEVPKDEAARILAKAEKAGPIGATAKDTAEAVTTTAPAPAVPTTAPAPSGVVAPAPREVRRRN